METESKTNLNVFICKTSQSLYCMLYIVNIPGRWEPSNTLAKSPFLGEVVTRLETHWKTMLKTNNICKSLVLRHEQISSLNKKKVHLDTLVLMYSHIQIERCSKQEER